MRPTLLCFLAVALLGLAAPRRIAASTDPSFALPGALGRVQLTSS